MKITKQNKNILIVFGSILLFILLLFFAYEANGVLGAIIAEHMVIPLKTPLLAAISVLVGVAASAFKRLVLFKLPLSFCFGIAVGVMLQPGLQASTLVYVILAVAVVCWLLFLILSLPVRFVGMCFVALVFSMCLSYILALGAGAADYVFPAIYGITLSTLMLIACGICAAFALSGISFRMYLQDVKNLLPRQDWRKHASQITGMFL